VTSSTPMLSVYDNKRCIGFLINRGKLGVEAFDSEQRSIGIFTSQKEAADAISEAKR